MPTSPLPAFDAPDFARVFDAVPEPFLLLRADPPDFPVVAANAAFLVTSRLPRSDLLGRGYFEVFFPESHPSYSDLRATERELRASLDRVVATGTADALPVQRYDLPRSDGVLEESYWGPTNTPIFGADGRLTHIVHHAHNVTVERAARHAFAAQEQQFHTLAEAIPQLAWIAEPDGSILWYNQRWYDYTGSTPDQMAGWGWQSVHDPAELPRVLQRWRASIDSGEPFDMEFPLRGGDGRFRWFLTRVMPVKDADGRVLRWFGTNTNIDEQRTAARAIEERQERLEAALRASGTGTFRWDIGSAALDWDESLDALFGLPPGAVVRSLDQFIARVHPDDRARVIAACERCAATGSDFDEAFRVVWPDGSVHWLDDKGKTFRHPDGTPDYMTGACIDITERVARDAALQERARLAAFTSAVGAALTQSPDMPGMLSRCCRAMVEHLDAAFARIWTLDPATNVLELQASAGLYTHLDGAHGRVPLGQFKIGRIAEERRPHLTNDVLHDDRISDHEWAAREGMVAFAGFPLVVGDRLDGVMALFARKPLTNATLQAMEAVADGIALGIEQRTAVAELKASEVRYRSLVEASSQVVWVCDAEGRLTSEHPSWAAYTGQRFEEYSGLGWIDALHPVDRPALLTSWRAAAATRQFPVAEVRIRRHDGVFRLFVMRAVPIADASGLIREWVGACSDITDRTRAEQQLRDAQRMQAVGTLAGGVAHEINNQMTAALGFSSLVLRELGPDHPQASDMRLVLESAQRAARISQQLLAFTRQQQMQPRPLNLRAVVQEVRPVLQHLLGPDKLLTVTLSDGVTMVHADPDQVQQVLINLVANARDATDTGTEAHLTVEDVAVETEQPAPLGEPLLPGRYVRVTLVDQGHGMTPATLERIFEPFFTTKAVGRGTGLGLAMVYGTMRRHGGYVVGRSAPEAGTTMELYWPVIPGEVRGASPTAVVSLPVPSPRPRERLLVLVVEDEPAVRALTVRALDEAGYTVIAAADGTAAIEKLRQDAVQPQLVVTDVVMPRMNGRQLGDALRAQWPALPILYMSGHTGESDLLQRLIPPGAPFLQKPFSPESLVDAVAALRTSLL